jgi:hypothetical protein
MSTAERQSLPTLRQVTDNADPVEVESLRESCRANERFGDARGRVAVHWFFLTFIQLVLDSVLARMSLF